MTRKQPCLIYKQTHNPKTRKTMKIQLTLAVLALALATLIGSSVTAFGQGGLTPPGVPAPMMKSLDQIEARTPIAAAPYIISQPGSYYLTGNLVVPNGHAITIEANSVTLDLNGFTIRSVATPAAGYGVMLKGQLRDITILNGHIQGSVTNSDIGIFSGSGFEYGIAPSADSPSNVRVAGVSVSGCLYDGINLGLGRSTIVENCTVQTMGNNGIVAMTIKSCVAIECGATAIYGAQVSDCYAMSVGSGSSLYAANALNCSGDNWTGIGLYAESTAQNCGGYSHDSYGIYAGAALGCYGSSDSGKGLVAQSANACVANCPSGTAIDSVVANGCYAISGTNNITYKYNMP